MTIVSSILRGHIFIKYERIFLLLVLYTIILNISVAIVSFSDVNSLFSEIPRDYINIPIIINSYYFLYIF